MNKLIYVALGFAVSTTLSASPVSYHDPAVRQKMNDSSLVMGEFKGLRKDELVDFNASANDDSVSTADSQVSGASIIAGKSSIDPRFVLDNESASSGECIAGVNDGATRSNGGTLQECRSGQWVDMESLAGGGVDCKYKIKDLKNNYLTQYWYLQNAAPGKSDIVGYSYSYNKWFRSSTRSSNYFGNSVVGVTYVKGQVRTFKHGQSLSKIIGNSCDGGVKIIYTCLSGTIIQTTKEDIPTQDCGGY